MWNGCDHGRLAGTSDKQDNLDETPRISQLPLDLILKFASSFSQVDLCSLGSCSRFWREVSRSDLLWDGLSKQRWPALFEANQICSSHQLATKAIYIKRHKMIVKLVHRVSGPLTKFGRDRGFGLMDSIMLLDTLTSDDRLSFKDVEIFFFNKESSFALAMLGYQYSIKYHKVSPEELLEYLVPFVLNIQEGETLDPLEMALLLHIQELVIQTRFTIS